MSSSMMPVPSGKASSRRMGHGFQISKRRKSTSASAACCQRDGCGDERDPLAGDLVDDDEAGVLAAGLAGDEGRTPGCR